MTTITRRVWLNTQQAADYSGYSAKTIRRALETGELVGRQRTAGGRWRVHVDAVDAWLGGAL